MTYIVMYDNDTDCDYTFVDAENIEDCIIQFAEYTGDNSYLFRKALHGCEDVRDYVEMYNHFGQCKIQEIHIIEKTLYDFTQSEVKKNDR